MQKALLTGMAVLLAAAVWAQGQSAPKYAAKVPPSIQTPDTVETPVGTLKFFDGLPDEETVKKVYDNLDFFSALLACGLNSESSFQERLRYIPWITMARLRWVFTVSTTPGGKPQSLPARRSSFTSGKTQVVNGRSPEL
jgi:hypothetical protein